MSVTHTGNFNGDVVLVSRRNRGCFYGLRQHPAETEIGRWNGEAIWVSGSCVEGIMGSGQAYEVVHDDFGRGRFASVLDTPSYFLE